MTCPVCTHNFDITKHFFDDRFALFRNMFDSPRDDLDLTVDCPNCCFEFDVTRAELG